VPDPPGIIRKEVYKRIGYFDRTVRIALDYDLLCRLQNESFEFINALVTKFNTDGLSSSNYLAALKEYYQCYKRYFGYSFAQTVWYYRLSFLHQLLQTHLERYVNRLKIKLQMENW